MYDLTTRYCFFDTETSGFSNSSWVCQIAAIVTDANALPTHSFSVIIHSHGLSMPPDAERIHGLSKDTCDICGIQSGAAFGMLLNLFDASHFLIAHNMSFDLRMLRLMAERIAPQAVVEFDDLVASRKQICTMKSTTDLCQIPYPSGRKGNKAPKLGELYQFIFNEPLLDAHNALVDVDATAKCFFKLHEGGFFNVAN